MQIYLTNKEHGKKVAHAVQEADLDKLCGWIEVSEDEYFKVKKVEAKVEDVADIGQKRKGRPPNK